MRNVGLGLLLTVVGVGEVNLVPAGAAALPVVVTLVDGSRIVGTTELTQIPVQSESIGRLKVPAENIRSITLKDDTGAAQIALANGDSLQGLLELPELRLTASFGNATIARKLLRSVNLRSSHGATPEFDVLPFAVNSRWPAGRGVPAVIGPDSIVLHGQPIRTREAYSLPVALECDATFDATTPRNAEFNVFFVPEDAAKDREPAPSFALWVRSMDVDQDGGPHRLVLGEFDDALAGFREAWRGRPFYLKAGQKYHVSLECSANQTKLTFGDQEYTVPNVTIPYGKFRIVIRGWIPDHRWELRNVLIR